MRAWLPLTGRPMSDTLRYLSETCTPHLVTFTPHAMKSLSMTIRTLWHGALFLLLAALPATAQEPTDVHEHQLDSEVLGETRTFTVHLPASYGEQDAFSYPVLYLLDGESNAGWALAVSDFLSQSGATPELITVAVPAGPTRTRDYLPANAGGDATSSGQADRFLEHVRAELIPFVEANYRAAPLRLLSGHSMGGVFVTHTMISEPDLFDAYLAQSPYLADPIGRPLLDHAESALDGTTADVFYFANLGAEPELSPGFRRLEALLGSDLPTGVEWASSIEEGKTHMETRLVGHYDGLEHFFADHWRFSAQRVAEQGVAGLRAYIDELNAAFGYRVLVSESSLQQSVQILLTRPDATGAGEAAALYTEYYPGSPVAHFLRANASAASGAEADALRSVERAIELYEADPDESLAPVYQAMLRLRTRGQGAPSGAGSAAESPAAPPEARVAAAAAYVDSLRVAHGIPGKGVCT